MAGEAVADFEAEGVKKPAEQILWKVGEVDREREDLRRSCEGTGKSAPHARGDYPCSISLGSGGSGEGEAGEEVLAEGGATDAELGEVVGVRGVGDQ